MTRTFEEILAGAALPEATVSLCLNLDLVRQYEELERRLKVAPKRPESLADVPPATILAEEMAALREEMLASEVEFKLRATPARQWAKFFGTRPTLTDGSEEAIRQWDAWSCEVVSRACYEPVMTPDQVDQLVEHLSAAQWRALSDAAWNLNQEAGEVPLSAAASAITSATAESLRRHEPGESLAPASSEPSAKRSRSTSTTTPAA